MERKRRISAPFLRTGLNNYRQSKTAAQPENTIIALIQAGIADNIFSPIMLRLPDPCRHDRRDIVVAHGLIGICEDDLAFLRDRKSTRLNSSHSGESRMPSSA